MNSPTFDSVPAAFDAAWFAATAQHLLTDHDEQGVLDRLCERALAVAPGAKLCGITVRRRRGRLETLADTHDLARQCDELQYELGEGPCVDAAREGTGFVVRSTADDPRWPRWGPRVAALGVHSVISVDITAPPWHDRDDPLGAINTYSTAVDGVGEEDLVRTRLLAVHAGIALATARLATGLEAAVAGRHRIGLAQGIIVQRLGVTPEQAYAALERQASASETKVRDVAAHVVEHGFLPEHPADGPGATQPPGSDR